MFKVSAWIADRRPKTETILLSAQRQAPFLAFCGVQRLIEWSYR